jgi:hypothetical protein
MPSIGVLLPPGRVFPGPPGARRPDRRPARGAGRIRMNGENCHLCEAWAEDGGRFQKMNFLHCSACDLVFVPAAEQVSADQTKARYLHHHNTSKDAGYVAMQTDIIELLHTQFPTARRVLDYGSGPAPVLVELLREVGHEAAGYDPHFASDMAMTPPFDAVTAVETFEHFAEPRREVERILGLLRPYGCLLVQALLHTGLGRFADWWYARGRDPSEHFTIARGV